MNGVAAASASLLRNGAEIPFVEIDNDIILDIPKNELSEWDVVIRLAIRK